MDIKTLIFTLALGNVALGMILIMFQLTAKRTHQINLLTLSKFLQALGWYLLFLRDNSPDFLSIYIGNVALLSGFAYESMAAYNIYGHRITKPIQLGSVLFIAIIWFIVSGMSPSTRIITASLLTVASFGSAGGLLLFKPIRLRTLQIYLGSIAMVFVGMNIVRIIWAVTHPHDFGLFTLNMVHVSLFISLFFLMVSSAYGLLMISKDDTDQKLDAAHEEISTILETLPTGICVLHNRRIVRSNAAFDSMFEYQPGQLLGESIRVIYDNEEAFQKNGERIYSALAEGGTFVEEVPFVDSKGNTLWTIVHGLPLFPERGQNWAVFSVTNISKQKRQQEILNQQKKELQEVVSRLRLIEGIITICANCRKVRTKEDSWDGLEKYLIENADAQFSHGLCPTCYNDQMKTIRDMK